MVECAERCYVDFHGFLNFLRNPILLYICLGLFFLKKVTEHWSPTAEAHSYHSTLHIFPDRILFITMINEILCGREKHKSDVSCMTHEQEISPYATEFRPGFWASTVPGSKSTWHYDKKELGRPLDGKWNRIANQILDTYNKSEPHKQADVHAVTDYLRKVPTLLQVAEGNLKITQILKKPEDAVYQMVFQRHDPTGDDAHLHQ